MSTPPNFDRVARIYRLAEYLSLGPLLQRTRTHFLPQLTESKRAFVLGDGDGRFLSELLAQNKDLHATAVDSSEEMLALLRARCDPARLQTIHGDALTQPPPPGTNLIVTHFFLDCFTQTEIDALALQLAQSTQPGTLWLLSDFHIPERGALRPFARVYIRALYFAFRILTGLRITQLPNPAAALSAAGFRRIAEHQTLGGLLYTGIWQYNGLQSIQRENMTDSTTNRPATHFPEDPLPDPEPAAPSLAEPDPGVFHHEPAAQNPDNKDIE
jgi:ubiquinone/menaquinone biosynthesis C-methylase UbiE